MVMRELLRLDDAKTFEAAAVETAIARQQSVGLDQGVRSDQQVRHDARACRAWLATEVTPELSCLRSGVIEDRLEANPEKFHGLGELRIVLKIRTDLGPHNLAGYDGAGVIRIAQSLAGAVAMNRISAQDIQQDG
jgi:hypothetical protein